MRRSSRGFRGIYKSFLLAWCMVAFPLVFAMAEPSALRVTNNTDTVLRKLSFPSAPDAAVPIMLAPGATDSVLFPEGELLDIAVETGAGNFFFPQVKLFRGEGAAIVISVLQAGVPELALYKGKERLMAVTGDNTAWNIPPRAQALGEFPFAPGLTTREQAMKAGAVESKERNVLSMRLPWAQLEWDASLNFAGEEPDSLLWSVRLSRSDTPETLKNFCLKDRLEQRLGYALLSVNFEGKRMKDDASVDLVSLAAEEKPAPSDLFAEPGNWRKRRATYAPQAFFDKAVVAVKNDEEQHVDDLVKEFSRFMIVAEEREDTTLTIIVRRMGQ